MRARTRPRTTGLVLAAGGSRRLGQPKQLLPYRQTTLLGHVLSVAGGCGFDQLLCVIGGSAQEVKSQVDLRSVQVIENHDYGEGCSSSIVAALKAVSEDSDLLVLLLGDQPGIREETVARVIEGSVHAPIAVCAYEDGRGHPIVFARRMFPDLATLHGDKGIWKLIDRYGSEVADIAVDGAIPGDVDTWEDYEAALADSH